MPDPAPPEIEELARRRSEARLDGDFQTADRLRGQIEAAGWKVADRGHSSRLERAAPPDREINGVLVHGSSATVPSRLEEPSSVPLTLVLPVDPVEVPPAASVAKLRSVAPDAQLVIVARAVESAIEAAPASGGDLDEVLWLAPQVGLAGQWNAGIRRAVGSVVAVCGPATEISGDFTGPAIAALDDSEVAVSGTAGLASSDLRHWQPADGPDVDALDADLLACRRADAAARGPLDERFATSRLLAIWWSLVLRDSGEDGRPRRAVALRLPVRRPPQPSGGERDRAERRDFYRLLDRFGGRYDLLLNPSGPQRRD